MKKFFYCAATLAMVFFAASCQQENLEPVQSGNTVTYTVQVPEALATKALGDEIGAVNELVYEVYRTEGERVDAFTSADNRLYHAKTEIVNGVATVNLEFVNNQNFTVLFWAHTKDNGVYNADNLTEVTITSPDVANNVNAQAFVGRDYVVNCVSDAAGKVTLSRPVSQLNLGTTVASLTAFEDPITISGSSVSVKGLSTSYNVAALSAGEVAEEAYVYTETACPDATLKVGTTEYVYVAMNYVGFAANTGSTVEVSYGINTSEGQISNTIKNVPVKPNYRTNIVGNLITSTSKYTVELDSDWATDGNGDMSVINNGVVKNVNGDYEVSNAAGLAYAINYLFVQGGDFYLHPGEYDMSDYNVVSPSIEAGIALNLYGKVPAVTRSSETAIVIKGLDVAALISEVAAGAQATFTNIHIESQTDLVGTNNGTVGISGCSNNDTYNPEELISDNTNGDVVNLAEMNTYAQIKEALKTELSTITLTGDVTASEILTIDRPVTIDGNGYVLTSRAGRAINVITHGEVTIKNLTIVGEGTCQRGINVIDFPATVNLDNLTASGTEKFLYATYAYLTPVDGVSPTINIKNSNLTGWAAIALYAEGTTVNVVDSHLKGINTQPFAGTHNNQYSVIAFGRDKSGMSVNVKGGSITAQSNPGCEYEFIVGSNEGCTDSSITLDTELCFEGELTGYVNIDPKETVLKVRASYADAIAAEGWIVSQPVDGLVTVSTPAAKVGNVAYGSLEDAVAAAKAGDAIELVDDVELEAELTLPANVTLIGNGKQIDGTIYAGGDLTFAGHTKVTSFSASYYNRVITIGEGACLEITGGGRVSLAYGNTFNITGSVADAKTADKSKIQPSLIIPAGISITGGSDATMNVTNAYVKIGNTSSKNNAANGKFTLNFINSIAEFTNQLTFAEPTSGKTPTFNMNVKNTVLTTGTKLCVAAPNTNVVIDNSTVTLGNYFRNSGEFLLKNGSVLTGATIQFGENGGNNGILTVDASKVTINASDTGHALDGKGTGSIILNNSAEVSVTYYKAMTITTDETSTFTGTEVQ